MQSVELNVTRSEDGRNARRMRRGGRIPAVFYGAGGPTLSVEVDEKEFMFSGLGAQGAHLIKLISADPSLQDSLALVREVQMQPVSGRPLHIDLLRLDPKKPVQTEVALAYVGKAEGVIAGGILQPIRRLLEVTALPDRLPEVIEVDVSGLGIHDAVHVEDLKLPEGVEGTFTENFTLVTVVPPVVEVVEVPEEGAIEGAEAVEGEAAEGEAPGEQAEAAAEGGEAAKEKGGGR